MRTDFDKHFPLKRGRAHEVTGPGAAGFAAIASGLGGGPALWVVEGWQGERLNPVGLAEYCDPQTVLMAQGRDQADVLAVAEEALRSGVVQCVVAELSKPLGLTAGRRLQLAAEAGKTTGVFLIADGAGSNAAETRWRCTPQFDPADSTLQRWEIIKNKSGTLTAWTVRWDAKARRIIVVSKAGERAGSARPPG